MALPKIGFNEGSLLRRTLLHVGTFLVGSAAFIGIVSFVLVTIAKGIVAPRDASDEEPDTAAPATTTAPVAPPKVARPQHPKTNRPKRGAAASAVATAQPAKDE